MTYRPNHPLAPLWAEARAIFSLMFEAFGGAQAIMDLIRPSRAERRDILRWLEPLEALVRRLLLIEAAECEFTPQRAYAARATRPRDTHAFKVALTPRFIVPLQERRRSGCALRFESRSDAAPRSRLLPAVRLGLRYAALRNVLVAPARFITRLARRLIGKARAALMALCAPRPKRRSLCDSALARATFIALVTLKDTS